MATVLFTQSAETDLLEIWAFVAEESFEAADHVLDLIARDSQTLALQPLAGRERPELALGLRLWPTASSYNLYYFAENDVVTVLRVLHHSRDVNSRDIQTH